VEDVVQNTITKFGENLTYRSKVIDKMFSTGFASEASPKLGFLANLGGGVKDLRVKISHPQTPHKGTPFNQNMHFDVSLVQNGQQL